MTSSYGELFSTCEYTVTELINETERNGYKYTDAALFLPKSGHCGYIHQLGEVRFYCEEGGNGIGNLRENKDWEVDRTYDACGYTLGIGDIPFGTEKNAKPGFWDANSGYDGPGFRGFFDSYYCCMGCPREPNHRAWGYPTSGADTPD